MNLFTNYYVDPDKIRQQEILTCFLNNLSNKNIDFIYLFASKEIQTFQDDNLCWIDFDGRPTYQDYFTLINKVTRHDDINVVTNSDIYLGDIPDPGLDRCFALTRWDILPDGSHKFYNNSGSQDTWVFKGPIKQVRGADFTQGVAGCDNKIAWLLDQAGYKVLNPSKTVKTYHLHNSGVRHYDKPINGEIYRLPHPRKNVQITSL